MEWQVVNIESNSGNNIPFVSIGRGTLDFNAVACDLVNDDGSYCYAQLLTGKEKNGKVVVAVKFLKQYEPNTIKIKRKTQNGKPIKGMAIVNKGIIEKLFGKDGANEGRARYSVEKVDENTFDMLKIVQK